LFRWYPASVIGAWQRWGPAAPDELYASLLLKTDGKLERPPVVDLFGSMLGSEHDTAELLDELVVSTGADPTSAFRMHMSLTRPYDSGKLLATRTGPRRANSSRPNRSF
jgi:hypothetical protein